MPIQNTAVYYGWSRKAEIEAPLFVLENRFPALFESRRLLWPRLREYSNPAAFDQGIAGFLDHILKANFVEFVEHASKQTGHPVRQRERADDAGVLAPIDDDFLRGVDTLVVISFDSIRTGQALGNAESQTVRAFLQNPDHLVVVCPHHEIGARVDAADTDRLEQQKAEFLHHGDRTIPPQQCFGGLARSMLSGLGVPVANRFGLRPASSGDGAPERIQVDAALDRMNFLEGVVTFNLHPHLPHLEREGDANQKLDVLVRQAIDRSAPPHRFGQGGRTSFDALLQSRENVFPGCLLVGDATLFSSTAGGVESLRRLWTNIIGRGRRN